MNSSHFGPELSVSMGARLLSPPREAGVSYWHITKFCCNAKFGRNQMKADMAGPAVGPVVNDPLRTSGEFRMGGISVTRATQSSRMIRRIRGTLSTKAR
jgi:hypothetical protein